MLINYYYTCCFFVSQKAWSDKCWPHRIFLLPHHSDWATRTILALHSTDFQAADHCLSVCCQNAGLYSNMPSFCWDTRGSQRSCFFAQDLPLKSTDYFLKTLHTTYWEIFSNHGEIWEDKQRSTFSPLTLNLKSEGFNTPSNYFSLPLGWHFFVKKKKKATYKGLKIFTPLHWH